MKRKISQKEYQSEARSNPKALDYPEVQEQGVIFENNLWLVVRNIFPYTEYDGKKVSQHWLIVPKSNKAESMEDLKGQELKALKHVVRYINKIRDISILNRLSKMYIWREHGGSIKKLHIHYLELQS